MRALSFFVALAVLFPGCQLAFDAPPEAHDASARDAGAGDAATDCALTPLVDACLPPEPVYDGPSAPIEVIRDDMGIPHVYAGNDADAYYASGYMQAVDRLFEMDLTRRRALGRRAEVLGAGSVDDDVTIRTFDIAHWADLSRRQELVESPEIYALHVAWTAGVNARIDEVRSGAVPLPYGFGPGELDYMPEHWTVGDAAAVGKLILFGNAEQIAYDGLATVVQRFLPTLLDRLPLIMPARDVHTLPPEERPPSTLIAPIVSPGAPRIDPPMPNDLGVRLSAFLERWRSLPMGASNNWVVDARHSANGRPLLAGDPHQGLDSPSLMWTHQMNSADAGGTIDAIGFNFVGSPSIQLGHNAHLAWGATTTYPDWMDLWGVRVEGSVASYGGTDHPIVLRREEIRVAGEAEPRVVEIEDVPDLNAVLMSDDFFPVPLFPGRRILLRWIGFAPTHEAVAFHRFDTVSQLDDFDAAVDLMELSAFNFVAANSTGITYRSSPQVPIRAGEMTVDRLPYAVLDGDDVGSLWTGDFLPFSLLPHSRGGTRGWIATANDEPYGLTDDGSIVGDPFYFGVYFDPGTRAARIESELGRLATRGDMTIDDMLTLQDDTYNPFTEDFLPPLFSYWDARMTDPALAAYRDRSDLDALVTLLRDWDRRMERTSSEAVVFNALMFYLARITIADDLGLVFNPILDQSDTYIMKLLSIVVNDTTPNGDTFFADGRSTAFVRALDSVASYLTDQFGGTDRALYTWGAIHGTYFHSISGPRLDGGFWPTDGSLGTVNVSDANFFDGVDPRTRLESTGGSIFRLAVQFAADGTPEAMVNIPRGVSGDPDSPHFGDLQADWVESRSRPLLFRRADVEAVATEHLTLR